MALSVATEARVRELIAHELVVEDYRVADDARFVEDLSANSLDMVELAMSIEEEWGIQVSDDEFAEVTTVADVLKLLEKKGVE